MLTLFFQVVQTVWCSIYWVKKEEALTSACTCWGKCLSSLDTLSSRDHFLWEQTLQEKSHKDTLSVWWTLEKKTFNLNPIAHKLPHTHQALSFSFPWDQRKCRAFPLMRRTRNIQLWCGQRIYRKQALHIIIKSQRSYFFVVTVQRFHLMKIKLNKKGKTALWNRSYRNIHIK